MNYYILLTLSSIFYVSLTNNVITIVTSVVIINFGTFVLLKQTFKDSYYLDQHYPMNVL